LGNKGLIDSAELESLKTKEYTKKLFKPTDYQQVQIGKRIIWEISFKEIRAKSLILGPEIYVQPSF